MSQPKASVIVAVYKVEEYIERCLHSLFGQTLDSIEYIFVDDASPDASMEILERVLEQYPDRKEQVKIIRHDRNQGIAAARTSGILAATGEYMIHCDPDDYVELNMYEEMYDKAKKEDSDLVFCDYIRHFGLETKMVSIGIESTPHRFLKYNYGFHFWAPFWNILVRSSIIHLNNIIPFKGGDLAEDYGCLMRIFFYSRTLGYIQKPLYHYIVRDSSIINRTSIKDKFDIHKINIDGIAEFLKNKRGFKKLRLFILLQFKFNYKSLFTSCPDEWFCLYRASHRAVLLLKSESIKTRIIYSILLQNHVLFKIGNKLFKKIKGKSLLE